MIAVFIVLFSFITAAAEAQNKSPEQFFDFAYAQKVWTTMDRAALDAEWNRASPAWEKWAETVGPVLYPETLARLEKEPNAALIKRGHDLHLVWSIWDRINTIYASAGWNGIWAWNKSQSWECRRIQSLNLFTRQCNDTPDWRTPEQRAHHDAKVKAERERKALVQRNKTPS